MFMSRDQNIARNGNIKIGNLSFEEVEKFKYLGVTVTNTNDTREEIKHRINMENVCYYSVEKLLSSSLLSKNLKVRIYKTVILPVVLYGCETWTLTLREEQRLRVFENKVLRKIFVAKRDEVTEEWRKLHNTELHALYSSPEIIRNIKSKRLRWVGHVAPMGKSRNAYRVLVGRPEGKKPLGRPRRRWEDNIKMDLRKVGYDDSDWINLTQDRDRWANVRAAITSGFLKSHLNETELLIGLNRSPTKANRILSLLRPHGPGAHPEIWFGAGAICNSVKEQHYRIAVHESGEIICEAGSSCDINKRESNENADRESDYPSSSSSSSMDTVLEITNIEELNKSLMSIESSIKKRKLQQKRHPREKFQKKAASLTPLDIELKIEPWDIQDVKTVVVQWVKKNYAETDQEEKKKLVGTLAKKKLPTKECTGRNGEREKSSGQKKISDDKRH
ncbi:hypothetical protein ANN_11525 [Periplaneta americana]|uniref:Endonuclease-reverse transcriptase n=1 Tax=Periplaneta americana TaxID=6978 RepID=A0ABQ8T732_PERAM|nr:hypothetical protein ANN_11525 [Periplaneta americana]